MCEGTDPHHTLQAKDRAARQHRVRNQRGPHALLTRANTSLKNNQMQTNQLGYKPKDHPSLPDHQCYSYIDQHDDVELMVGACRAARDLPGTGTLEP